MRKSLAIFLALCAIIVTSLAGFAQYGFNEAKSIYDHAYANSQFQWSANEFARILPSLEKCIDEGYGDAAYMAGEIYLNGYAEPKVPRNLSKAENLLLKAIQLGSEHGRLSLADLYVDPTYKNHDNAKAFRLWQEAMDYNEWGAPARVAAAYYFGIGTKADYSRAYSLCDGSIKEIAEARYPLALAMLGDICLQGSVPMPRREIDATKEAVSMYYYSGIPSRQLEAGRIMFNNDFQYVRPALINNGGSPLSIYDVLTDAAKSTTDSIAAEACLLYSKYMVRHPSDNNDGYEKMNWGMGRGDAMLRAAELGSTEAMQTIASWYELGVNVPRNLVKAKEWREKYAAATGNPTSDTSATPAAPADDNEIYTAPYRRPEFPGGDETFRQWVNQNLNDPGTREGTVKVGFVVEKDGSLSDIRVDSKSEGVTPAMEREALRLVRRMPRFSPALNEAGTPVRAAGSYTVRFRLMQG